MSLLSYFPWVPTSFHHNLLFILWGQDTPCRLLFLPRDVHWWSCMVGGKVSWCLNFRYSRKNPTVALRMTSHNNAFKPPGDTVTKIKNSFLGYLTSTSFLPCPDVSNLKTGARTGQPPHSSSYLPSYLLEHWHKENASTMYEPGAGPHQTSNLTKPFGLFSCQNCENEFWSL